MRAVHYALAGIWTLIVVLLAIVVMGACLGPLVEGIANQWIWLPALGEIAVLVAVGVATFRSAMPTAKR